MVDHQSILILHILFYWDKLWPKTKTFLRSLDETQSHEKFKKYISQKLEQNVGMSKTKIFPILC